MKTNMQHSVNSSLIKVFVKVMDGYQLTAASCD
jgi:hypothetical protein